MGSCTSKIPKEHNPQTHQYQELKNQQHIPDDNKSEKIEHIKSITNTPAVQQCDKIAINDDSDGTNSLNPPQTIQNWENITTKKRNERKKTIALLMDLYLTQLKRKCKSFDHWDVPRDIVAVCILYYEATDGSLIMRANSFIQLNANYQYVFEDINIGESSTLSARQNNDNKAKITIHCFGSIKMNPYSYIHLNDQLQLSSYIGYAIYIEAFGDIIMERDSHIDVDSDNASIFIKCNKMIMNEESSINAANGQKIILVVTDEKNRNELKNNNDLKITPKPEIYGESPMDALENINKK